MSSDFRTNPELQPVLQALEEQRKSISAPLKKGNKLILSGLALIVISCIFFEKALIFGVLGGIILIFASIFFYAKGSPDSIKAYRIAFKKNIIGAALRSLDESMVINPTGSVSLKDLASSQLFQNAPDRCISEDHISGKAGKTAFYFCEIDADYRTISTNSNGKTTETWHDVFKGIIFSADFNKNFNGVTLVYPAFFQKNMPGEPVLHLSPEFLQSRKRVKLENQEFSKTFFTYSTDQIEARYILTPHIMEKVNELNKKCKYTISLSFVQSRVFIAFPLMKDYFEAELHKSVFDPAYAWNDLQIIKLMYNIIEDLNLNTRIWGKE